VGVDQEDSSISVTDSSKSSNRGWQHTCKCLCAHVEEQNKNYKNYQSIVKDLNKRFEGFDFAIGRDKNKSKNLNIRKKILYNIFI
jgi:hypothetical protein